MNAYGKSVIVGLLLCISIQSIQSQTPDSLRRQAEKLIKEAENEGPVAAIEKLEAATKLYRQVNDRTQEALTLLLLSPQYLSKGQRDKAEAMVAQAETLEGDNPVVKVRVLMAKATIYGSAGKLKEAIQLYEEASVLSSQGDNESLKATINNDIAIQYAGSGERQKAIFYLEKSLQYLGTTSSSYNAMSILSNLAILSTSAGDYQRGLNYIKRALVFAKTRSEQARCFVVRGGIFQLTGNNLALVDLESALALYEAEKMESNVGECYHMLGEYWVSKGEYSKALAASLKAESKFVGGHILSQAGVALQLGQINRFLNPGKAQAHFERIIELKYPPIYVARALIGFGQIARERGDFTIATEKLQAALKMFEGSRVSSPHKADCLHQLARTRYEAKDYEAANAYVDRALEIIEDQKNRIDSRRYQAMVRSKTDDVYQTGFEIKQQLDPRMAYEHHERYMGQRLRNLAGKLRSSNEAVDKFSAKMSELARSPKDAKIRGEADALAAEMEAQKASRPTLSISEIQARLPSDSLLLEFVSRSNTVFAISANSFHSYSLPIETNSLADEALKAIIAQATPPPLTSIQQLTSWEAKTKREQQKAVTELSVALLSQIGEQLNTKKKLILVMDGALSRFPFSALLWQGKPLVETHEIVSVPTASMVGEKTQLAFTKVAVIAATSAKVTTPGKLRKGELAPLMNAPAEIAGIRAIYPQTALFAGQEANRSVISSLQSFDIIHFVAHSAANFNDPEMSVIHLNANDRVAGDLFAMEISKQSLEASLVVLSSCESSVGAEVKGEGVNSLAYSFMLAGAKQVISSQWPLDDAFAAVFMRKFYAALKVKPDAAYALRQAQLQVKEIARWQSPFYWAAFTVQGQ